MLFRQGFDKEKHKQQNKLRRLWRLAVATHPQMQANGIIADWGYAMGGCGATARRHSLLGLYCYLVYNQSLHANAKRAPALLSQH